MLDQQGEAGMPGFEDQFQKLWIAVMRIAVCQNGTNPPVNYYKITTKLNTLCFKSLQVFYFKSAPVRGGSPG